MSFEEEDSGPSLKELVTKNLEANGILGKLQAQLRASIFLILEDEMKEKGIPLVNKKALQMLTTPVGRLAVSIIEDFLKCLTLEFSLAVFTPESNLESEDELLDRSSLFKQYGDCQLPPDDNYPFLFKLIENSRISHQENINSDALSNHTNGNLIPKDGLIKGSLESSHPDTQEEVPLVLVREEAHLLRDEEFNKLQSKGSETMTEDIDRISGKLPLSSHLESLQNSSPDKEIKPVEYDEDERYSSLSEVKAAPQDEDEEEKSITNDNTEEDIAEEIEEDIPIEDDMPSSLCSGGSNETKDVSLSQISSFADYQESL